MTHERDEADKALDAFRASIQEAIDEHWSVVSDMADLDPGADEFERAEIAQEMGPAYCAGWVMVIASGSVENPDAPALSMRLSPRGQSPFLGIGLMHDQLAVWSG